VRIEERGEEIFSIKKQDTLGGTLFFMERSNELLQDVSELSEFTVVSNLCSQRSVLSDSALDAASYQ
jgi:hypothetical protein